MSEPIKRKRRTRNDSSEGDCEASHRHLSLIVPTKLSPPPPATKVKSDNATVNYLPTTVDSITTSHQMTIDRIRSEINEDNYHHELDEPHYSNDSYDWGDNLKSASSDY